MSTKSGVNQMREAAGFAPPNLRNYRADIDGLRAVAVLLVVVFHAFPSSLKGGFVGVDVFFVISGYLLTGIVVRELQAGKLDFWKFYSRRIRRIFPALVVVLIACFVLGWFTLLAHEYKQLGKHILGGAIFIPNLMYWQESGYFDNFAETKPLLHLWSLGIEEQFYIFWPAAIWLTWKARLNTLGVTVALVLTSFVCNAASVFEDTVFTFYMPQTRAWELLTGAALSLHQLNRLNRKGGEESSVRALDARQNENSLLGTTLLNWVSALGVVLISGAVFFVDKSKTFPGYWAVLPVAGSILILLAGPDAWLNRVILSHHVLVWVGKISFPLYLWHWPLLVFAAIMEGDTLSAGIRFVIIILSVKLAWITYIAVERPVRFGSPQRNLVLPMCLAMAMLAYAGYMAYRSNGFDSRFPLAVREFDQKKYDSRSVYREGACLLTVKQDYGAFKHCPVEADADIKPMLILWGDSHAAHLYPGYRATLGDKFNVVQRTASGCAPILNLRSKLHPKCVEINQQILDYVRTHRPARVVVAANWDMYEWKSVALTVAQLREAGVRDIDLIGPVPQWRDDLNRQLYLKFQTNGTRETGGRTAFGLNSEILRLELGFASLAKSLDVNYISPIKILCNDQGCITKISDAGNMPMNWDSAHLTAEGSVFLVSRF